MMKESMNNKIPLYFAAKALILRDHRFLALKRSEESGDFWELPGGRLEYGETLEETLHREIKEETNLDITPRRILNTWDLIEECRQISGIIYLCDLKSDSITLSNEHSDYRWFHTSEIDRLYPVFSERLKSIIATDN
ncbi:MAG: NUDIX domain-containing protein [Spirochaetales bacterium]|nr:NUDIX domain-containing protein [Spirochaetales bacterium]